MGLSVLGRLVVGLSVVGLAVSFEGLLVVVVGL